MGVPRGRSPGKARKALVKHMQFFLQYRELKLFLFLSKLEPLVWADGH